MEHSTHPFDEQEIIDRLRHYLPHQAALKDFVHHNTLHAFQTSKFHDALWKASSIFGYKTYLSLDEFRSLYHSGKINPHVFEKVIDDFIQSQSSPQNTSEYWKTVLLEKQFEEAIQSRLNQLRRQWKSKYKIQLDKVVHPVLFRLLSAYLDQGISSWSFPYHVDGFLTSIRALENYNYASIFKTKRARKLLLDGEATLSDLLHLLIGDASLFDLYLFEQQFVHPGWSGFVATAETTPSMLLKNRPISLHDMIYLELLLEIDALDHKLGEKWAPLSTKIEGVVEPLFFPVPESELKIVLQLWQEAYEWTYFDGILSGILEAPQDVLYTKKSFQGLFCIDDREYSFRRHLENVDPVCETYGTPGYFGVEFYFQAEHSLFPSKACPAPIDPKFLIQENERKNTIKNDPHFHKTTHGLFGGWLTSGLMGYWSAAKLFGQLFRPSISAATVYSFAHMDRHSNLQIESTGETKNGLHVGFTIDEMTVRVFNVLKSIGLTSHFAPIVYVVGHGGSSVNNPYYAGYDCGACSGRPGAVNARVFAQMANKKEVRLQLIERGMNIPEETIFISAMHDTTRDEIEFHDERTLSLHHQQLHKAAAISFEKALELNAKERSLRFEQISTQLSNRRIHTKIKRRSVSLFEPRPEWNHTDNALCIIGRKSVYSSLYLDKRPFLNSYDYVQDPDGTYLLTILKAAVPVCGGINLEYYFSRVDQQKLGAGTKLPHNVVGLFAVNNGIDGDLRPGLPSQMIEIHDPIRLLIIIEHDPNVVEKIIQMDPSLLEWFTNKWVLLAVKNPIDGLVYSFSNGAFYRYEPVLKQLKSVSIEEAYRCVIQKIEPTVITSKN